MSCFEERDNQAQESQGVERFTIERHVHVGAMSGMKSLGHVSRTNSQSDKDRLHVDKAWLNGLDQAWRNFKRDAQALKGFGGSKEAIKSKARLQ